MGPTGDRVQIWGGEADLQKVRWTFCRPNKFRRLLQPVAFLVAIPSLVVIPGPASAAGLSPMLGDANFIQGRLLVLSALAAGAVALAVAASLWALAEQRNAQRLRRGLRGAGARAKAAVGERDALLGAGREALVAWGRDGSGPFSYGGGDASLQSCLKGPDALVLSQALDDLSDKGITFQLNVHDQHGRKLVARGRAVGSMAAVWLEEPAIAEATADFRAILDALPIPVWLRDKALALTWANHAFIKAAGASDLETARREQVALDKGERE